MGPDLVAMSARSPEVPIGAESLRVSVVVPARDEQESLGALLDGLLSQTYLPAEIIVVDGGSTDATTEIARAYEPRVRVESLGPAFPGRARNHGANVAGNEWIAFIDAGCVPDARWLENLIHCIRDPGLPGVVFGGYEPLLRTEWDVAQALTVVAPLDPSTGIRSESTASLLVHRDAMKLLGGFPEQLRAAEDLVFFQRLAASPLPVHRQPSAVVRWTLAPSPVAFFRRLRSYSRHHVRAGLFRTWHARVMVMDLVLGGLCVLALATRWVLPVVVGLAIARVLATVGKRRHNVPSTAVYRIDRLMRVAILLALADAAVWTGAVDWCRTRSSRDGSA
jgi:glycosyltransferase involved in cell wall biosynthesis